MGEVWIFVEEEVCVFFLGWAKIRGGRKGSPERSRRNQDTESFVIAEEEAQGKSTRKKATKSF